MSNINRPELPARLPKEMLVDFDLYVDVVLWSAELLVGIPTFATWTRWGWCFQTWVCEAVPPSAGGQTAATTILYNILPIISDYTKQQKGIVLLFGTPILLYDDVHKFHLTCEADWNICSEKMAEGEEESWVHWWRALGPGIAEVLCLP